MTETILTIEGLSVALRPGGKQRRAILSDVSLTVGSGDAIGLVGESGSGKTTTARAAIGLFPQRAEVHGRVDLLGQSVLAISRRNLRILRGRAAGMIYQDPRAHINPLRTVGDFVTEGMLSNGMSRRAATARALDLLDSVSIGDTSRRMRQYPGELSGGMLQRVMIASVLATEPQIVLADEPTSALDVTTQEEVVAILGEMCAARATALLFITHNIDLAMAVTGTIMVMYAGRIVEVAPSDRLHVHQLHPYTAALFAARPSLQQRGPLQAIPGEPIAAYESGLGCPFAPRCAFAVKRCLVERPELRAVGSSLTACHRSEEIAESGLQTGVA